MLDLLQHAVRRPPELLEPRSHLWLGALTFVAICEIIGVDMDYRERFAIGLEGLRPEEVVDSPAELPVLEFRKETVRVEIMVSDNTVPWEFPEIGLGLEDVSPVSVPVWIIDTSDTIRIVEVVSCAHHEIDLLCSSNFFHLRCYGKLP